MIQMTLIDSKIIEMGSILEKIKLDSQMLLGNFLRDLPTHKKCLPWVGVIFHDPLLELVDFSREKISFPAPETNMTARM